MNDILVGLVIAAGVGIGGFGIAKQRDLADRRVVHRWLKANTRAESSESHVGTGEIAKGVGLPDERVRQACLASKKIHRATGDRDQWSVWREEPQSVYEKNGGKVDAW